MEERTIRVNESTLRLAETIAARCGISVAEIIDLALVEVINRADHAGLRASGHVIDLESRRRGAGAQSEPKKVVDPRARSRDARVVAQRALGRRTALLRALRHKLGERRKPQ
jgi:hypothetical protein